MGRRENEKGNETVDRKSGDKRESREERSGGEGREIRKGRGERIKGKRKTE